MNNRKVGLSSPSLFHSSPVRKTHTVSVDVKHDERRRVGVGARELCEQAGGLGLSFSIPFFPRPLQFLWT